MKLKEKHVTIYLSDFCMKCSLVIEWLNHHGVEYTKKFVDDTEDEEQKANRHKITRIGMYDLPVIETDDGVMFFGFPFAFLEEYLMEP